MVSGHFPGVGATVTLGGRTAELVGLMASVLLAKERVLLTVTVTVAAGASQVGAGVASTQGPPVM